MFTGIVEETGTIRKFQIQNNAGKLTCTAETILSDIHVGDSIAVNGICLTVVGYDNNSFTVDVMPETMERSSLKNRKPGDIVNLERAMPANGRFGGHIVSGHIDGTGQILAIRPQANAVWFTVATMEKLMKYIVEKGSITIDGISLTVASVETDSFQVSVIPHTLSATSLGKRKVGDLVNLENDMVGKYIEKFMTASKTEATKTTITRETLLRAGF